MGWFSSRFKVNTNLTLNEGTKQVWTFTLTKTSLIDLTVERQDGDGPNVYMIPADEYHNYCNALLFSCVTSLSYKNIEYFSNNEYLRKGSYYLVAELGSIADGMNGYSNFNLRCEELV